MKLSKLGQQAGAILCIATSGHALANGSDENNWQLRDGFSLSGGVFFPDYDTKILKSNGSTNGSKISLEDDLGLADDDEIPYLSVAIRPWPKHRFFFSYMGMDRSANSILTEDLTFDGITFPQGTDVDTDFDINLFRLGYTWSFLQTPNWELGFSTGAYWIDMDMRMAALEGALDADYNESEPFPMVGFSGSWLLSKTWLIRGTAEAFRIDMNDTEGDFYNVRVEAEYKLTERVTVGAGYDLVGIDAEDTKRNNEVHYDYEGALLFLRWHF